MPHSPVFGLLAVTRLYCERYVTAAKELTTILKW